MSLHLALIPRLNCSVLHTTLSKELRWLPSEKTPASLAAINYLKSRQKSNSAREREWIREALTKIDKWLEGSQEDQAAAWYYTMFCQGYGYGIKKGGSISSRRGWLPPSELDNHLGLGGKDPHYLAIRPSKWVGWAAIDIDEGSRYHPSSAEGEGIEPIKEALLEIGLINAIEFQSSTSSGIHLWYPLATLSKAWDIANKLEACLFNKGLEIYNGVLELRPNKKHYESDYLLIRAPLTGEGNSYWAPEYGDFGFLQELRLFHKIWLDTQEDNQLKPLKGNSHKTSILPPNRRGPVKGKYNLKDAQERLKRGFTKRGDSQDLKLSSLMVARLIEGIDKYIDLKERTHEILENLPGFNHYCGHKREIAKRTYITKKELRKSLQMVPGGYKNTWKEESNLKRARMASEAALEAIEKASGEGRTFKSENKAIKYLQTRGGPCRSWWRNETNKEFLEQIREKLIQKLPTRDQH